MPPAHLTIGTSTDRIDLLNPGGFMLRDWKVGGYEPDTIFQESRLADFRQMAAYRDVTVIERFELVLRSGNQDQAARAVQDLRAMTRLCLDYWTTTYQTSVVYLETRASCETNMRYAVVYDARLVGESNPLGQPFVQHGGAVMDELGLLVERGPWLDTAPGSEGTCVEISSQGPSNNMFMLDFDGAGDDVNCGSDASIDNLPSADMTVEAWVNPRDWGGDTDEYSAIMTKGNWYLAIYQSSGVVVWASHAVTQARTITGYTDFPIDGEWKHVAAVWDQSALQWDIAINGRWVDTTITVGAGAYTDDSAFDLYIGNNFAGVFDFDGYIGWCRLSDTIRYPVGDTFTPTDRCTCPTVDGDTVALWCFTEGTGATTYDETANNNDGTITNATWEWAGCEQEYMEATCEDLSVFVANKFNTSPVTNCYFWDNSLAVWNGAAPPENLIGEATPFDFLPAAPAVDDFVIFGTNTALADTGPFCSLVFDISTAIGSGATLEWRYKGTAGADTDDPATWTALTVQDNTNQNGLMTGDPFDWTGIGSVHWEQPADWVTSDPQPAAAGGPLGVTGYWVACYVTAGPAASPPEQDNRDIYTVLWPYTEFAATEVGGDLPALLRLAVDTRSAQDANGSTTDLYAQRIMVGLRSMGRGENFSAYINLADEQLPTGTSQFCGGATSYQDWVQSPTGRAARYRSVAADTMAERVYVALTPDYYGRFHAFVRCYQDHSGTVQVQLEYPTGTSSLYLDKQTVTRTIYTQDADVILDFGEISIGPSVDIAPYELLSCYVNIRAFEPTGGVDTYFYDLILIPVDEWAIDCEDMFKNNGGSALVNGYRTALNIDAIQNPRQLLSWLIRTRYNRITRYWRPITNGIPILQTGKHQRLWFLHGRFDDYADADDLRADHELTSTIQIWKQQRYTTLRGDR